jgi:hypothetical protein
MAGRTEFGLVPALLLSLAPLVVGDDATEASGGPRRELREQLGASVNNLGLQNSLDFSWSWPLSASESALLSEAHLALGVSHALTPSYTRVGAWAELSPLSVLDLRVGLEPAVYFGTFNSLMSFDSYRDPFDKDARDKRGGSAFGTAGRVYLSPTLKMKAGPVVAIASAEFDWWKSDAAGPLFYEPARDTLLKAKGDALLNTSSLVLYQHDLGPDGKLSGGLIHQITYVYGAPANKIQRLGTIVVREFGGKRFGLPHARLVGLVSYYLDDPSKRHQLSAALALAFKVTP